MRSLHCTAALVLVPVVALAISPATALDVGYNQAWLGEAYGHDLTASFDQTTLDRTMRRASECGARVVRMWLFEGRQKDGILWNGAVPSGVDPRFLDNVSKVMASARRHNLKIYWTLFDGNWFWARSGREYDGHWNILQNRWGAQDLFEWLVLEPVLDRLAHDRDLVYAIDLMNEVQGAVRHWDFTDGWTGARRFTRTLCAHVKGYAPWARVTISAGHHTAVDDVLAGRFSGLGLDFFDIHLYNDTGTIPRVQELRALARRDRVGLVLGEFGQSTERRDDALQSRVTEAFLWSAWWGGFDAALGWRLDDERRDPAWKAHHSYYLLGLPRPAAGVVKRLAPFLRQWRPPW